MPDLPANWGALCALVFLLGVRHGFEADHLAAIDGLTRAGSCDGRSFSRYFGVLFSLGHGVVVFAVTLTVSCLSKQWVPPAWLDMFGAGVSTAFLLAIGIMNLRAVLQARPGSPVALVGVKGRLLGRFARARGPLGAAAVGALFALSFDTMSLTALFAMAAARFGGAMQAVVLGGVFVLGMVASGGMNGWWVSRLLARSDRSAVIASRVTSGAVSIVSLLVAALGIGKLLSPAVEVWSAGKEFEFGVVVVLAVSLSALLTCWLSRESAHA